MRGSFELFQQYPTPKSLEFALMQGRQLGVTATNVLYRKFKDTPIALALEKMVTEKLQPDGAILVDDLREELTSGILEDYGRKRTIWFHDEFNEMDFSVFPENNRNWHWGWKDSRESVQHIMQAALEVKKLVLVHRPDLIKSYSHAKTNDRELGFDVTLIPEIPEGMFLIKESGEDSFEGHSGIYTVTPGQINYEQWTIVDTRNGLKQTQLLFMGIVDNRTEDGKGYEKEFNKMYWLIPELQPFNNGELNFTLQLTRQSASERLRRDGLHGHIPHVFGHLPEELNDLPKPANGGYYNE